MSKPKPALTFARRDPESTLLDVYYANGLKLGQVAKEADGFYCFWMDPLAHSSWPAYMLQAIADELNRLNEPWAKQVSAQLTITE